MDFVQTRDTQRGNRGAEQCVGVRGFVLSPKPACPDPLFGQTYGGNSPHHARRILNELARSKLLTIHQGLVGVWSTRCSGKSSEQIFGTSGSVLIYRDVRTDMLSSAVQHTVVGCIAAEAGD